MWTDEAILEWVKIVIKISTVIGFANEESELTNLNILLFYSCVAFLSLIALLLFLYYHRLSALSSFKTLNILLLYSFILLSSLLFFPFLCNYIYSFCIICLVFYIFIFPFLSYSFLFLDALTSVLDSQRLQKVWQGINILHDLIALIFIIQFLLMVYVFQLLFYERTIRNHRNSDFYSK